jgi:hypothetical protein
MENLPDPFLGPLYRRTSLHTIPQYGDMLKTRYTNLQRISQTQLQLRRTRTWEETENRVDISRATNRAYIEHKLYGFPCCFQLLSRLYLKPLRKYTNIL